MVVKRIIKDLALWVYWYPFRGILRKLSPDLCYRLAKGMASLLSFVRLRKKAAMEHELDLIFNCAQRIERDRAIRESFEVSFLNEVEMMFFARLNRGNIGDFISVEGLHNLDDALSRGKGAMLLFAHFGANQMVMPAIGYGGYTMSQLSAPAVAWINVFHEKKFSAMEKRALELRWQQELTLPVTHIDVFGSLKEVFACLKRNEILGIAIDGGGGTEKRSIDFFGKKIVLSTGAIEIAARTGCAVLPVFVVRDKSGKNRMIIEEALKMPIGKGAEAIEKGMALFVRRLEEYVRKYPGHYLNYMAFRRFMTGKDGNPFIIEGQ